MGVLQAIIATAGRAGGSSPPPGPITPEGTFLYNSSVTSWATTNETVSTYSWYQFPDGSSGSIHSLGGSQYLLSPAFSNQPTLNINLWFKPTTNSVNILAEIGQTTENTSWHYTMLEIDGNNHLRGRVWEMAGISSTGTVTLNDWNHVYLYFDYGANRLGMSLNGETAVTSTVGARHTSDTGQTYFGIGLVESTTMAAGNRFQGQFNDLSIDTTITGSTFSASRWKYHPFNPVNSGITLGPSWTVEMVAELTPTRYWATLWGNEEWNAGNGHLAFLSGSNTLVVGRPNQADEYTLTDDIQQRAYWAFTHADGQGIKVYRNGILLTPTISNYVQPPLASNTLLFGSRHDNGGGGTTDSCPGNYLHTSVNNVALDASYVASAYNGYNATYSLARSLSFNGTQGTQLDILGTTTDWALGNQGTIEWWQKAHASSSYSGGWNGGIISQGSGAGSNGGMDIFQAGGLNTQLGGNTAAWPDPTGDVWTHVAVTLVPSGGGGANAHVYYNGVEQTLTSGYSDSLLQNAVDILHIGCRIPDVNYQNWSGLITNIHINSQVLYTGNFTPSILSFPITGTKLLLTSANPKVDLSTSAHTTSGTVTLSSDVPTI